jgi:uncharacterized membrane protein
MDQMVDNENNYKWGIFYFNRLDSRTIVPKRNKYFGWTLNFARPQSYLFLLFLVAIAVLMTFLPRLVS